MHGRHAYNRARRRGQMSKYERQFFDWVERNQRENAKDADEREDEINEEWYGEEEQ